MKIKHTHRNYLCIMILFTISALLTVMLYLNQEQRVKAQVLESGQRVYAQIIHSYIIENQLNEKNISRLSDCIALFPKDVDLTVYDENGHILFRNPSSNQDDIFYYSREKNYIIRIGFSPETQKYRSSPHWFFILVTGIVFLSILFVFTVIYRNFRKSVSDLKYFFSFFRHNNSFPDNLIFPDEDLDEIQKIARDVCNQYKQNEHSIAMEREKLIEHFHYAEEGISFFTPKFRNIYTNSHFIQYMNILMNETTFDVGLLFKSPIFSDLVRFLENPGERNMMEGKMQANGRTFYVQVIIFDDRSFEIILRDVTKAEQDYFDRSEMTNNIAHELLTPVTSVRGYLDILLEHDQSLYPEKRKFFIQRTHSQILRLIDIIQDTVLLSRVSHTPKNLHVEEVNLFDMLNEMVDELTGIHNTCVILLQIDKHVSVKGNRTLLHSIFRNLGDNAVKYASENVTVTISNYTEDDDFYYFSFSDNGMGIEEKQLDRIFERFYRIDKGRVREAGGSGLGLSIVKEAVTFHHGNIHARNRTGGGLEFLFTLRKQ